MNTDTIPVGLCVDRFWFDCKAKRFSSSRGSLLRSCFKPLSRLIASGRPEPTFSCFSPAFGFSSISLPSSFWFYPSNSPVTLTWTSKSIALPLRRSVSTTFPDTTRWSASSKLVLRSSHSTRNQPFVRRWAMWIKWTTTSTDFEFWVMLSPIALLVIQTRRRNPSQQEKDLEITYFK